MKVTFKENCFLDLVKKGPKEHLSKKSFKKGEVLIVPSVTYSGLTANIHLSSLEYLENVSVTLFDVDKHGSAGNPYELHAIHGSGCY